MYENPLKDIEEQLDSFEKEYSRYGALFLYGLGNGVLWLLLMATMVIL